MLKHKHLIIRSEIKNPPKADDIEKMNFWFADLIHSIGMKILSGPYTVYSHMQGNRGFTGVCVIETSHIAAHFWDEDLPAVCQLDIYSCADFHVDVILEKMRQFDPVEVDYTFLDREDELRIIDKQKLSFKAR